MTLVGIHRSHMQLARSCALAAALVAGGCSVVYDTGDLRAGRDGGGADADPDALFVSRVAPDAVLEGEGSSFDPAQAEMVRAIPIVLEGQNMTADTTFTIDGLGLSGAIEEVAVSGDGRFAAFALRVPVADQLAAGVEETIDIQLVKGEEEQLVLLRVTGLDPLVRDGAPIATGDLEATYSHVALTGEVVASGAAPLRITATAGISVAGTLRADAGAAPSPGPGGCPGGDSGGDAACGPGSGRAGESSPSPGGGGGGGYGTEGTAGTGGDGQPGGDAGNPFLVALPPAEGATARGAGGGGGGDLTAEAGGPGGGSGGVIELTTPAVLSLGAGALLSAAGGDGATALCTAGGGGGGGSGGAILLRAGRLVTAAGASAAAPGGAGRGSDAGCRGGNGGKGRIRIDSGNGAAVDADPAAFVGPAPVIDELAVIVDQAELAVPVRGRPGQSYQLFLGEDAGAPMRAFETGADGLGSATVTLQPGLNRLCVQVAPAAELIHPESKNCVNVAYIAP